MDQSDNTGVYVTFGKLLRDIDVLEREFVECIWLARWHWLGKRYSESISAADRSKELVEAVQKGDSAAADEVLRRGGVRRD